LTEKEKIRLVLDVTPSLNDAINQAISKDSHSTRAEFIRDTLRRRLEDMGYHFQVFSNKESKTSKKQQIEA
jgi:Arc/MetJ-type ribon-helix-helix transcriptional regulator